MGRLQRGRGSKPHRTQRIFPEPGAVSQVWPREDGGRETRVGMEYPGWLRLDVTHMLEKLWGPHR